MSWNTYRYTPSQLLVLLRTNRFSFLTDAARERIDALMEVVVIDVADHAKHCDEFLRWNVVAIEHQVPALQRLAICREVCEQMESGKTRVQAISGLLAEGNRPKSLCMLRDDVRRAVIDLKLSSNLAGMRRVDIWLDRLVGQESDLAQMLAMVDEEALAMSEDSYITRLAATSLEADRRRHVAIAAAKDGDQFLVTQEGA
ncbi:hypothetical protein [Herbaspirillum sp.]|uniref:hypothetical protein n=1 Tax=Herbaspirillum sp. TaxID=1890675 RepID=UPI001B196BF3|nr:hypothetical protein [Herbaspirillum sp.]MBO9538748.1 hypothetical protein [Herbaspirillum sp.]